jgi:flagellar biosynthesis chaperone FliJ
MQGFHVKLAAIDLFIQTLDQAITAYKTTEQHLANGDFSADDAAKKQLTGHSEHTSAAAFTEACGDFVSKYSQLFHQFNRANTAIRSQLEIMATNFAETRSEYANFEASNVTRFESLAADFSTGPEGTGR